MNIGIVGAGILGRLLAFELMHAGNHVTIVDKNSQRNCSVAAAGLLAPTTELEKHPLIIYQLGMAALTQHWPAILAKLHTPIYFQKRGSLVLSHPQDKPDLLRYIQQINAKAENIKSFSRVNKENILTLEPELTKFADGYYFADEGQLDSQQLLAALEVTLRANGVEWVDDVSVIDVCHQQIQIQDETRQFDMVFDCRGLGAKNIFTDLRSVRGELIWLHAPDVNITRPIRFLHPRYSLYIVPRPNNLYLIGASEIESDDLGEISVRTSLELLTAAYYVHPGFCDATIIKTVTQCRPTLTNHLPGIKYHDGFIAVNGLYRHGYLLAPTLIAEIMNWLCGGFSALQYPSLWEKLHA